MRPGIIAIFLLLLLANSYAKPKQLIILNEDTWSRMLVGEWMIEFFAPWCPACKSLQGPWEEFSSWSTDLGINVAQVDVTNNPGLSGRFMVNALPTIFHVKDGKFRQYRGSRDKEEFISFIEDQKWQNLEEITWWKSPASVQMSLVSYFFKLSMVLRSVHNTFVEEYKFPFWASLLIFALSTILIGVLLGLILVCVVDLIFPPKALPIIQEDIKKKSEHLKENINKEDTGVDETVTENSELEENDNQESVRRRKTVKSSKDEITEKKN